MFTELAIWNQLRTIRANQRVMFRMLARNLNMEADMAKTLDDILASQAVALQKATDNITLDGAIKDLVNSNTQMIQDLRDQLAAAGTDPAKIQQISDNMDALIAAQDADTAASAVLAGTPPGTGEL